jgi:hypothetical protein
MRKGFPLTAAGAWTWRRVVRLGALLATATVLAGCAAPAPTERADPLSVVPEDFSIDLGIECGRARTERPEAHLRPGRFVLLADGSLHYGDEAEMRDNGPERLPPRTRVLDRAEVAGLWSMALQLGFADPAAGEPPVNLDLVAPPPGGILYATVLVANGGRWMFLRESAAGAEPDPPSAALARRLAELAWVSEVPGPRVVVQPRRYDLGPDPYARYRDR